eukprot:1180829-Prorocentrum_minimum.AAC.1
MLRASRVRRLLQVDKFAVEAAAVECYYRPYLARQLPTGEKWEKVGNWTQGEKRGRASGVLSASLPLLAQEDP